MPTRQELIERGRRSGQRTRDFLGGVFQRGQQRSQDDQEPTTAEQGLEDVTAAGEAYGVAAEEDYDKMTDAEQARVDEARTASDEMKAGQDTAMEGVDAADAMADQGVAEVRAEIDETRASIENMPQEVADKFEDEFKKLDDVLTESFAGLDAQRSEALGNVMEGRSQALQAATQTIHGQARQQNAKIDAMVQQGQLSPSQGAAMKAKASLGASMALAPAIGQTVHAFVQTQAEVATSFGSMFTNLSGVAAQTTGAFGAAAGQAYASTQQKVGELNTRLTEVDAQITGQRSALYSQNAATRVQAQNMNDTHNKAMLDHTAEQVVLHSPIEANQYQIAQDIFGLAMQTEHGQAMMDLFKKSAKWTDIQNILGLFGTILQGV